MKRALILSLLAASLVGCASAPSPYAQRERVEASSSAVVNAVSQAADRLAEALTARMEGGVRLVVASAVHVDDLSKSSTFGRALGEQLAARLAMRGHSVSELKLRSAIFVSKAGGELLLSRDVAEISASHKAKVVVVGTYAPAGGDVLVTLKAVDVATNQVVAGHTFAVPKADVWSMLNQ